ncbi:MAG: hypothetical protein AAFY69_05630 [Pseudomonadota bacterium]
METLFRFNMIRDNYRTAEDVNAIDLSANTRFQRECRAVPNNDQRLARLKSLARAYAQSANYISSAQQLNALGDFAESLSAVDDFIAGWDGADADLRAALEAVLTPLLPDAFATLLAASSFRTETSRVKDSMLVMKLLPDQHRRPILLLGEYLRLGHILRRLSDSTRFPASLSELRAARRAPMQIAPAILPEFVPPPTRTPPSTVGGTLKGLAERHAAIGAAISELRGFRARDFVSTPQRELDANMPPQEFRPFNLFKTDFEVRKAQFAAFLTPNTNATAANQPQRLNLSPELLGRLSTANLGGDTPALDFTKTSRLALLGRTGFTPLIAEHSIMQLKPEVTRRISQATRDLLAELDLSLDDPLNEVIGALIKERAKTATQSRRTVQPFTQTQYKRMGGVTLVSRINPVPNLFAINPGDLLKLLPNLDRLTQPVPTTHADLRPAGEMELLVVKQQLLNYITSDISHITNVLKGEFFEKTHRVLHETERLLETESEVTSTVENSLETSDRFEVSRETEDALKETLDVKGSLEVSGKLGPQFKYKASGEVGYQRVSESSVKASQEVAREVTQKASEKITERVLRRESLRIKDQIENTDIHRVNNEEGDSHTVGIYQWLSKVYQAQMYNYGLKEVYDLMIPEPGALLMELFNRRRQSSIEIEEVPPLEITPEDIDTDNYQELVKAYHATDVEPPPEPYTTISYDFNTGGEDKDQEFTTSTRIQIPEGYRAERATVGSVVTVWDDWSVDIVIGERTHRFHGNGWVFNTPLNEETGSLPFAMVTDRVGDVAIAVKVVAKSTERAMDLWRADTYAKLVQAYQTRKSEQEAKLADMVADAPAEIESGPEAANRALMVDEIKRACISILTRQHFDLFNAVRNGTKDLPEIRFDEALAEGDYVRFFEQAFEWENLSWVTYPYFWGRKDTWDNKVFIEDDDRDYQDFLKAGYVRVVLPVRDGFGAALDHFRQFGEPWLGGPLPTISDDLYLPIADEIAERLGRPGDEVPFGDPWPVVVPTRLMRLRSDSSLPAWEEVGDGTWVESDPA